MKRIFLYIFLGLIPLCAQAHILETAASRVDIRESLVLNQEWVSYPSYDNRKAWDELLEDYKSSFISCGERYLNFEWLVLRATDYLEYNRSGNRYTQEDRITANATALANLMMAELAEGKGRFMDDIINGVFHFCECTSWAVSDHLFKFQRVQTPLPDFTENILALKQGNFAQMLSWIYYFFHGEFDKIDPVISARLEYEIRRRELDPFIQRDDFTWMGFLPNIVPNNWNPWCNSNAILCFMLIENDRDALCAGIKKAIASLDRYLAAIPSDGACDEGTVYWYVSAGNLMNSLKCLEIITGGRLNIWNEDLVKRFGEFIVNANIEGKWQANFADAKPTTYPSTPFIYRYGKYVGSKLMCSYALNADKDFPFDPLDQDWFLFYRSMENLLTYKEIVHAPATAFKPASFTFYPETELCYMRSGKGYLAVKGGNNKERHNHNDVGSCIYYYDGNPVLVDAGPGTYNKSTFDKKLRYKIWNMSSDYHNVPNINGYAQEYGRDFKAVETKADECRCTFSTDIAAAYPDSAGVNTWKLTYRLLKDGSLDITENFNLDTSVGVMHELHFLIPSEPVIKISGKIGLDNGIIMKYDSSSYKASYERISLNGTGVSEVFGDSLYRINLSYTGHRSKGATHVYLAK